MTAVEANAGAETSCRPMSGALYRHLFDSSPHATVILSASGDLLEANQSAVRLLQLEKDTPEAFSLKRVGLDKQQFSELKGEIRKAGTQTWAWELSASSTVALDVSLSRIPDHVLDVEAYRWTAYDVTHRVTLEETREHLTHMIVHDLRVPLANILNSLDLVLTAWRERDVTIPVEQVLGIAQRSARRMEGLIGDILDAARLQTRVRSLTVRKINVAGLVREVVETVAGSAERRQQSLLIRVPPDLPPMVGDPDLIRRVFVNLLGNAIKYTQHGGEILVTAELNTDWFTFAVVDNGSGIAPEDQKHIFELFFRGRMQLTKGAGIGLAFSKLAVEAHGGRIGFESELEKGSTFFFTIPRVLPDGAVVSEGAAE